MRMFLRTLKMAFHALRNNVMRAALTTLGIVIGVAAVITMVEIGNGAKVAIQRTMVSMGANTLVILPGAITTAGVNNGAGTMMTLTPRDKDAILKECSSVLWAAPIVRARAQVVYGNRNWVPTYVYGTTPSFLDIRDWTDMAEGEAFTEHEVLNSSKVCLVGQTIVREVFAGRSPIGQACAHQERRFQGHRSVEQKRRKSDGHGPGRYCFGAVDHCQISRGRFLAVRRQPELCEQREHLRSQYA